MKISGVILAAGEGRRIGIPKAILKINGNFLADIQFELLNSAGIEEIKIVAGADSDRVKNELKYRENVVVNENYRCGQFSSLVAGIKSLRCFDRLVVLPVDVYPIERDTIIEVISGFDTESDAAVPVYQGKRGHPVVLSYGFTQKLLLYDIENSRLDRILWEVKVREIKVRSKSVLNNINTPYDLRGT
ncbi:MAG: NTP transferase domain-containing protein [Deltaproteobacteria bacterium]|nr:NTP transferase domain-containing protein [Deltaproteobacteria bacterium]